MSAEQLDVAASYFLCLWQFGDPEEACPEEWLHASEAHAYVFTVRAEAWRQFCDELGIAADALTAANHRGSAATTPRR